jgi:hypothetical protein
LSPVNRQGVGVTSCHTTCTGAALGHVNVPESCGGRDSGGVAAQVPVPRPAAGCGISPVGGADPDERRAEYDCRAEVCLDRGERPTSARGQRHLRGRLARLPDRRGPVVVPSLGGCFSTRVSMTNPSGRWMIRDQVTTAACR